METENIEHDTISDEQGDGIPVCIKCLNPVDPLGYYCPHCGEASNQLTQYIPFVNIRWSVNFWGNMWRQVWSGELSLPARIFRLMMVIWYAPLLLIGLLFKQPQKNEDQKQPQAEPESK